MWNDVVLVYDGIQFRRTCAFIPCNEPCRRHCSCSEARSGGENKCLLMVLLAIASWQRGFTVENDFPETGFSESILDLGVGSPNVPHKHTTYQGIIPFSPIILCCTAGTPTQRGHLCENYTRHNVKWHL
jgi:hypothetical protein